MGLVSKDPSASEGYGLMGDAIPARRAVSTMSGSSVRPNALLGIVGANARRIETKNEPVVRGADADAISILDSVLRGVVDRGTGGSARRLGCLLYTSDAADE